MWFLHEFLTMVLCVAGVLALVALPGVWRHLRLRWRHHREMKAWREEVRRTHQRFVHDTSRWVTEKLETQHDRTVH